MLAAPDYSFSDVARKVVSIINLDSVAAIEEMVGEAGPSAAVSRQSLVGLAGLARTRSARSHAGDRRARLKVVKRIVRCAATNVDPRRPRATRISRTR